VARKTFSGHHGRLKERFRIRTIIIDNTLLNVNIFSFQRTITPAFFVHAAFFFLQQFNINAGMKDETDNFCWKSTFRKRTANAVCNT